MEKVVNTLDPVKMINNKGVEEVVEPFLIIESAGGYKTKICNFDHPGICKRTGRVEIRAIKKHKTKQPNFMFKTFKDRATDIRYGIPANTDAQGNVIWQSIIIPEMRIYDLTDINDAKEWAVVRMAHFLKGSPRQYGECKYEVIDHEVEASKSIRKLQDSRRVSDIIDNIGGSEMIDFARLLGIETENNSQTIIHGLLAEKAYKSPRYVLEKYDDANRKILVIIHRCLATTEIVYDAMGGFKTKSGFPLGDTEASVVSFFLKPENHAMLISLDSSSKRLDKHFKLKEGESYESEELIEKFVAPTVPNAEIAEYKKIAEEASAKAMEAAENTKRMMEMMQKLLSKDGVTVTNEVKAEDKNFSTGEKPKNPTKYTELQLQAKEAGIASWHLKKEEDLIEELKAIKLNEINRDKSF
jgi:hypothetical protein